MLDTACSSCQTAQIKITRTFCPIPNSTSFTSISTPLKLPPAAPLIPPGLPKCVVKVAFSCPNVELLLFLVDFLHIPKRIKNQHPPKTSQNLKSRAPRRLQARFITLRACPPTRICVPCFLDSRLVTPTLPGHRAQGPNEGPKGPKGAFGALGWVGPGALGGLFRSHSEWKALSNGGLLYPGLL